MGLDRRGPVAGETAPDSAVSLTARKENTKFISPIKFGVIQLTINTVKHE